MPPLVSAVMITYNRPKFVPVAVECFLAQTYPAKELVIIDDGPVSVEHLVPRSDDIQYIRCRQRVPVGPKWNLAFEAARGDLLAFWGDDDWHHPLRLAKQVVGIGDDAPVCAIPRVRMFDFASGAKYLFDYPGQALDGTFLFRRGVIRLPRCDYYEFPPSMFDDLFGATVFVDDPDLYIVGRHGQNLSPMFGEPYVSLVDFPLPPAFAALHAPEPERSWTGGPWWERILRWRGS